MRFLTIIDLSNLDDVFTTFKLISYFPLKQLPLNEINSIACQNLCYYDHCHSFGLQTSNLKDVRKSLSYLLPNIQNLIIEILDFNLRKWFIRGKE